MADVVLMLLLYSADMPNLLKRYAEWQAEMMLLNSLPHEVRRCPASSAAAVLFMAVQAAAQGMRHVWP